MSDPISKLRGLTEEIKAQEAALRAQFAQLASRLREASGGYDIHGVSASCTLQTFGEDDAYYGYLLFEEAVFRVAYRTREEDYDFAFGDEEGEPPYHVRTLEECSPVWLRALAAPNIIETLLVDINRHVEEQLIATRAGIEALSATANLPLRDLDAGLIEAAKRLNFGVVIEHWQRTQAALGVDPADATTRASSFIETVCKHILAAKAIAVPDNQSIQHLFGAAARALSLSPEQQRTNDLRGLAGGLNTVVAGIGTLRTHAGTAHGRAPESQPITFEHARLAVNAAGVLATFLMDALTAPTTPPPGSQA